MILRGNDGASDQTRLETSQGPPEPLKTLQVFLSLCLKYPTKGAKILAVLEVFVTHQPEPGVGGDYTLQ